MVKIRFSVAFEPEELEAIDKEAKKAKRSRSDFFRLVILESLGLQFEFDEEALKARGEK
ncbi:CopG family transcriptional regulator [Glaesserella parasuis]|uniref:ribbon-helix-helix protein, CopG family n=1 Tax=Glaesserella parasuis TaxID=738 RepID=UPI00136614EB|nr:CopG family transcriptional regulator [Glaesserella parasuis]MDG6355261.1 ribbon-helix-helix domain-containing protein [Glaesserella parasuis]MDO9747469.1 CopG family transcriptional regulator [Glaesserella parasuis]MDO9771659.1 CopG family transcriptional regulator [Glaesserella parasuis]MDO9773849.1 CopG family transcriptional regulator [Glaesserella parasuis]MDO9803546.1 CopG family transcriptional regulator [Glaesserella parasuis]